MLISGRNFTYCVFIPTKVTTNESTSFITSKANSPSMLEAVPTLVPFNNTVTPGSGSLALSVITPRIVRLVFPFGITSIFRIIIDCISNLYVKGLPSNNFFNAKSTVTSFTFKETIPISFSCIALYTKFKPVCLLISLKISCTFTCSR